jgi:hypothetical protein
MAMAESRGHPATLAEANLLADCELRRQRRSGPGGQHRNKVETAVVITHQPTGIRGEASERRSQEENRQRALFRLRVNLALQVRADVARERFSVSALWESRCHAGRVSINSEHADFPALLSEALDVLAAKEMDVKQVAVVLGCSTSQLIKFLQQEPRAIALVNEQRRAQGKPVYR